MNTEILNRLKALGDNYYDTFTEAIATPEDWTELRNVLSKYPWAIQRLPLMLVYGEALKLSGAEAE